MDSQRTIAGSVALVSGANRGIGAAFVRGLLANDAHRIYACARDPQTLQQLTTLDPRVIPIQLDIRNDLSVQAAAQLRDVNLLINNAGIAHISRLIGSDDLRIAQAEMDVNYFGTLRMCRAFAPILAANGGGTLVNLVSILGRVSSPLLGSYCASKAAAFSLTQAVRAELRAQGTLVVGVMPSYVDTDMTAAFDTEKMSPEEVAEATFEAIRTGQEDVYPGKGASYVAAQLLQDPKEVERAFGQL
jgi:NAD(P)-dependent dehydrogenase (short-subunit alcohol dehydrogenase family)